MFHKSSSQKIMVPSSFLISVILISIKCTYGQELAQQKIQSYASCSTDRDCKENAFCFGNDDDKKGYCKCIKGFELDRNETFYECFAAVKLKDACQRDIHCQVSGGTLATCNTNQICECNSESHEFDGKCYKKARLGDTCQIDANCYVEDSTIKGAKGFCVDGHCECNINEKSSDDNTRCLATRKLGQACTTDEECNAATPNTRCFQICHCATEYTASRNQTSCVKAATKFDEPCEFDGQCSKFLQEGVCNNGKCGCNDGFHGYGIRCVQTRRPGERCEQTSQCVSKKELERNVECENDVCQCLYGDDGAGSCKIQKGGDENNADGQLSLNLFILIAVVCKVFLFN